MGAAAPLPDGPAGGEWDELDAMTRRIDCGDYLASSQFARPAPGLAEFAEELGVTRRGDPLKLLREITAGIAQSFEYCPRTTRVDSPIEQALVERKGVCQDFSHIMIALVRGVGIPCR